jgi:hypothetical protein
MAGAFFSFFGRAAVPVLGWTSAPSGAGLVVPSGSWITFIGSTTFCEFLNAKKCEQAQK